MGAQPNPRPISVLKDGLPRNPSGIRFPKRRAGVGREVERADAVDADAGVQTRHVGTESQNPDDSRSVSSATTQR